MSDELERLRAKLDVLRECRHWVYTKDAISDTQDKISKLEAEAADPWREAKDAISYWGDNAGYNALWAREAKVIAYVNHLTAERDRLAARVAELEAENTAWKEAASVWTVESEMVDTPKRLSERIADLCGVKTAKNDEDAADLESLSDEQVDMDLQRRGIDVTHAFRKVRDALEAAKAEPLFEGFIDDMDRETMRVAEQAIPLHIRNGGSKVKAVAEYALMLRFDNARLQSELKVVQDELCVIRKHDGPVEIDDPNDYIPPRVPRKKLFDMKINDPILDPARVLATAEELMWGPTVYAVMLKPKDAKPYRMKGGSE